MSLMKKERGSDGGRSRAIRKAIREIFNEDELANQTPAGGGGRPPLSAAKLDAVQSK